MKSPRHTSVTGRMSNGPNLQNIPIRTTDGRRIRGAFLEKTDLHACDLAAIEQRIEAGLRFHTALARATQQLEATPDPHTQRAAEHFGVTYADVTYEQRRVGKALNFADRYLTPPLTKGGSK